ncbi:hypothetical protein B0H11DRAFT_2237405 [Mycena galericulata]|nr:hypothetical protein B0H11DRAFT_2237405 [Mycena galericulata]
MEGRSQFMQGDNISLSAPALGPPSRRDALTPSLGEDLPLAPSRSPSPPPPAIATVPMFGSRAPTPEYTPLPINWSLLSPPRPLLDESNDDTAPGPQTEVARVHPNPGLPSNRPSKRQRTSRISTHTVARFLDVEAREDDASDMEEEGEEDDAFIDDDQQSYDGPEHHPYTRREIGDEDLDESEMLEKLAARYVQNGRASILPESDLEGHFEGLTLLPTAQDPNLFGVKTKRGFEGDLLQAIYNLGVKNPQLGISSAFCREPGSGLVYVEAPGGQFLDKLLKNVYLRNNRQTPTLVPLHSRPELLAFPKDLIPGQWARVKQGRYKGQLAFLPPLSPDDSFPSEYLVVRQIPQRRKSDQEPAPAVIDFQGKAFPPPWEEHNGSPSQDAKSQNMLWRCNLKNGDLTCLNVHPTEAEISLFRNCGHTDIPSGPEDQSKHLAPAEGDRVIVTAGSDAGKNGRILRINRLFRDDTREGGGRATKHLFRMATVTVNDSDTAVDKHTRKLVMKEVTLPVTSLGHYLLSAAPTLDINDRVIVVAGDQQGQGGYVQNIDKDHVVTVRRDLTVCDVDVLDDTTDSSFIVPIRCLQRCFRCGDHVKVVKGQWVERLGWIVSLLPGGEATVYESTIAAELVEFKTQAAEDPFPNEQFIVWTSEIVFCQDPMTYAATRPLTKDLAASPVCPSPEPEPETSRAKPKAPPSPHMMRVNKDYTGLEVLVVKSQLKGLRGVVVQWNETTPLARASNSSLPMSLEEKEAWKLQEIKATAERKIIALKERYALHFEPTRKTEDTMMEVMLSVRLENRVKLDQIPGHQVVERYTRMPIYQALHVPPHRRRKGTILEENKRAGKAEETKVAEEKRAATPPPLDNDIVWPEVAVNHSIVIRFPVPQSQRTMSGTKASEWLLDKRLDIRIEGLKDWSLLSKLGKKAQRQEGALGILVLQSTVRDLDGLIQVQLGSVNQDFFRLPVRCIKPMRTMYRPGYVQEHTPLHQARTRVVIIGPDVTGDMSKVGEYAQVDPEGSIISDVVKVVFPSSFGQEKGIGYYNAKDLCRSVNETIEWQGFPVEKSYFL